MMGMGMGVGFSSPPPWTPAALGPAIWLETDAGVTVSGGVVDAIADRSASGRNVTAAADIRPAWVASGSSGFARFDGVDDHLDSAVFTPGIAQPLHHFIVCKVTQTEDYDCIISGTSAGAFKHQLSLNTIGTTFVSGYAGSNASAVGMFTAGAWQIIDWVTNGAASKLASNGGAQSTIDCGTTVMSSLRICGRNDSSLFPQMDFYAYLAIPGDTSGSNRAAMLAYLRSKAFAAGIVLP